MTKLRLFVLTCSSILYQCLSACQISLCATGECIAAEQECDGVINCEDESDEGPPCGKLERWLID